MSKCEVWLEFDRAHQCYLPGESITGRIHVRVNKDCRCNEIRLRLQWRTHGRGNIDSGGRQEFVYAKDTSFYGGEEHRFPFELTAPMGPLSYHGELINIDWYLRAAVDIPWALDPTFETELLISGAELPAVPAPELAHQIEVYTGQASADATRPGAGRTLMRGALMLGLVGLCIAMFFMVPQQYVYIPFIILCALIVRTLVALVWFRMKGKKLAGKVKAFVIDRHLRPNGLVACDVRLSPPQPERIEAVTCTLRGREIAVSGSGTDESTYSRTFHQQSQRLPGPFHSSPLEEIVASFALRLPAHAPSTFTQDSNEIVWELEYAVELAKWPDYKETTTLRVSADRRLEVHDVEV